MVDVVLLEQSLNWPGAAVIMAVLAFCAFVIWVLRDKSHDA